MLGHWTKRFLLIVPYYLLLAFVIITVIGGAWGIATGFIIPAEGAYLMLISAALWYFFAGLHRWVLNRWPFPISLVFRQPSSSKENS